MVLIDTGTRELAADNKGEGSRPRRETTATRDSDKRRRRQPISVNDCGGLRRLPRTAIATLIDNGTQELVADNDGEGMSPGSEQRWCLAFNISGNKIPK